MRRTIILVLCLLLQSQLIGAYFQNLPTEIPLPDGSILKCYASGDEFYNWLHDKDGYTLIKNPKNSFYYYAQKNGTLLQPSAIKAGSTDLNKKNFPKFLKNDPDTYLYRSKKFNQKLLNTQKLNKSNKLNNLVIMIRFSDQSEFVEPRQFFNDKFNAQNGQESVYGYFNEASYGKEEIISHIFPLCNNDINLSVVDPHPRSYYLPYDPIMNTNGYQPDQESDRLAEMQTFALEQIKNQVPMSTNFDMDNDGYIDNVSFIVRGPHSAWAQLLWAHRAWYNGNIQINGKFVADYTFQPENQNTVRTLCHELFHSLGAPDLYHYNFDGLAPTGCWDIMESGFVHMGAYMKYKYGNWLSELPQITTSGEYSLKPLTSENNNCYKIAIPGSSDFLLLEYRKFSSNNYERNLPASGLLVYRINDNHFGNSEGPPDEIYVFRENGTQTIDGKIFEAAFCKEQNKTSINRYTNPALCASSGNPAYLNIYDIGFAGDSIIFKVDINGQNIPPIVDFYNLESGTFLKKVNTTYKINASAYNSSIIDQVKLYIDGNLVGTDTSAPFEINYNNDLLFCGKHDFLAEVIDSDNRIGEKKISITIFNQQEPSWFDYISDNPLDRDFNRGCLPIKFTTDFNLGNTDYLVKKIFINIASDPFGLPEIPGQFGCKIVKVENNNITSTVLVDLGTFISPLNGKFEAQINNQSVIQGNVALIMDIGSYQKMMFDQFGISGHAWVTEPDRPWTDVLSRGVLGAPEMGMQIIQKEVSVSNQTTDLKNCTLLGNYPNPFNNSTSISYQLNVKSNIELTVFNMLGELVKNIYIGNQPPGCHSVKLDFYDTNSGVYTYRLRANNIIIGQEKILLLK